MELRSKRAYLPPDDDDGTRILVDRLWPRGLSKQALGDVAWMKAVAPSDALRKWFGHDPARWEEFARRYRKELDGNPEAVARLREALAQGDVTLLYGARDEEHNQARVIARYMQDHSRS